MVSPTAPTAPTPSTSAPSDLLGELRELLGSGTFNFSAFAMINEENKAKLLSYVKVLITPVPNAENDILKKLTLSNIIELIGSEHVVLEDKITLIRNLFINNYFNDTTSLDSADIPTRNNQLDKYISLITKLFAIHEQLDSNKEDPEQVERAQHLLTIIESIVTSGFTARAKLLLRKDFNLRFLEKTTSLPQEQFLSSIIYLEKLFNQSCRLDRTVKSDDEVSISAAAAAECSQTSDTFTHKLTQLLETELKEHKGWSIFFLGDVIENCKSSSFRNALMDIKEHIISNVFDIGFEVERHPNVLTNEILNEFKALSDQISDETQRRTFRTEVLSLVVNELQTRLTTALTTALSMAEKESKPIATIGSIVYQDQIVNLKKYITEYTTAYGINDTNTVGKISALFETLDNIATKLRSETPYVSATPTEGTSGKFPGAHFN